MKKIKIYSLIAALFTTFSCSGFLDEYPDSAIPERESMETVADCSNLVTGIYNTYMSSALYSGSLTLLPDIQSDLVYQAKTNTGVYADIYRWEIKPNTVEIEGVYATLYKIIAICNFFDDYKAKVEATIETDAEKEEFERRLGDVSFARALANAELIRMFCEAYDPDKADTQLGISLPTTAKDNVPMVKRSSLKESYQKVLDDLDVAEKYLPEARVNAYFSLGTVNALRARVYLYMHEYQKSIDAATKVINSDMYELSDATEKMYQIGSAQYSDYEMMWRYDESDEIIWRVAMTTNNRGGALGRILLGYNGATYSPDFVLASPMQNLYSDSDQRLAVFFAGAVTSDGSQQPMVTKYLGNSDIDGSATKLFTNMPKVFRLSEVYMNRAEAYYNLKKYEEANEDLTSIRRKRIKGYGQSSASAENMLKEIQEERVREFFMEGFRLSDLKRWNIGFERKKQLYTVDGPKNNALKVSPTNRSLYKYTTWPIPKHEIEATNGLVVGNESNN